MEYVLLLGKLGASRCTNTCAAASKPPHLQYGVTSFLHHHPLSTISSYPGSPQALTGQWVAHVECIAQQQRARRVQWLAGHLRGRNNEPAGEAQHKTCMREGGRTTAEAQSAITQHQPETCRQRTCLFCMQRMRPCFTAASKWVRRHAGTWVVGRVGRRGGGSTFATGQAALSDHEEVCLDSRRLEPPTQRTAMRRPACQPGRPVWNRSAQQVLSKLA